MDLNDFVVLLPCVAAMIIGFLIKRTLPVIPNRFIPLICAVVGVGVNVWMNLGITPRIFVEGMVSGIAATGMFELVRNFAGKKEGGDSDE